MNAAILCLISMLGSDKFLERDFATNELSKVMPIEILIAEPINFEAKLRLQKLRQNKKSQMIEKWLNSREPLPWIHPTVSPIHFPTYEDNPQLILYPSYRKATRRYLSNFLWEKFDFSEAQVIVDKLQDFEEDWLEQELRLGRKYRE